MTWLRDEVLVAYADNQLTSANRRAVEQVLAVDPEARHTVALFKLSALQVRQCFDALDFGGVPSWFKILMARTDQCDPRNAAVQSARKFPKFGVAMAACLVFGALIGHVTRTQPVPEAGSSGLSVLGDVGRGSVLEEALNHVAQTGTEWTGPDLWRATLIASFRDRFGSECREVELHSARGGAVPAQVFVACRGASSRWTVVGAASNEVMTAPINAYYVPTEGEARSSLNGILSMLGAQQRTSAAERKTMTP